MECGKRMEGRKKKEEGCGMVMQQDMQEILAEVVQEISQSSQENELINTRKERRLPSRKYIIEIIKDLRRVMFPGYFGDENITISGPEYFVGHCLTMVYEKMKPQMIAAFAYHGQEEDAQEKAEVVCRTFFQKLPEIQKLLLKDVQAFFDGDPAAKSKEDIIFSYPGFFAIYVYRMAHELYLMEVPFVPRIMTEYAHGKTGIDINSGAVIGEYFFIDHGTGVVIGETTEIGDYVKLYQGVTLGALSTRSGQKLSGVKRHPTIGDHVTIYSGSSILGGETVIGEHTVIGGNAFITESVPAFTKVTVKNPELAFKGPENLESQQLWE